MAPSEYEKEALDQMELGLRTFGFIVISVFGFLLIVAATMAVGGSSATAWSWAMRTKVGNR
jgi:hypothetical protein